METTWDGLAPCKQELRWRQSKRDSDAESNFEMSEWAKSKEEFECNSSIVGSQYTCSNALQIAIKIDFQKESREDGVNDSRLRACRRRWLSRKKVQSSASSSTGLSDSKEKMKEETDASGTQHHCHFHQLIQGVSVLFAVF